MASPYRVAEEMLSASSAGRGLDGMQRTAAPLGPNMFDSGPASKVQANTQPFNNSRLREQTILQNTTSAASQASVDAVNDLRKKQLVMDNQDYKVNQFRETYKENVLDAMDAKAIKAMGQMSPIEEKAHRANIASTKAATMGMNPDLMQNALNNQNFA